MEDEVLYVKNVGKRSQNKKKKSTFPTIQRKDIMECILSDFATCREKSLLSSMYYEITRMETKKMKYISEIAISSQAEADLYDLINRLKSEEKLKEKKQMQNGN